MERNLGPVGLIRIVSAVGAVAVLAVGLGCRSTESRVQATSPVWDVSRAEAFQWRADDPSFEQIFAVEASGLAIHEGKLLVPSEKYARILVIDPRSDFSARVLRLGVPQHAELEGVAVADGSLLFCDEAHAAVYRVALEDVVGAATETAAVRRFGLEDLGVQGGKIGFEGIEVSPRGDGIKLLLERSGNEEIGCVSRIYSLRFVNDRLVSDAEAIEVELEDCNWRLTGLTWWDDRLIALKTQFPGERYEIVAVNLETGDISVLLEMTPLLRMLATKGWSNNVEGLAVAEDGALWLVADNAVTGVIDDPSPPEIDERTLLLRLPLNRNQD